MSALTIVLYKNKTLSNGEHPVRLRIYFGKERYISLGYSSKESEWNSKHNRYSHRATNYESKNAILRQKLNFAESIVSKMMESGKEFSIHEFKEKFKGTNRKVTVLNFLQVKKEELLKEKKIGNSSKYQQLWNMLTKYKKGDYIFSDIDYKFLKGFETFLLGRDIKNTSI